MAISQKSIKLLWANSAGRCAFANCQPPLAMADAENTQSYTVGEMAHIKGEKPGSNRYDSSQDDSDRNSYENLILLCPTHHTIIDKPENEETYSVARLLKIKEEHEAFILRRLTSQAFRDKIQVARLIAPLLNRNRDVFLSFGPHSKIAKANPMSDAHKTWLYERLVTIVPNNRRILNLVIEGGELFSQDEQQILSKFEIHARGYERWVGQEISYEGVAFFPVEFDELIQGLATNGRL